MKCIQITSKNVDMLINPAMKKTRFLPNSEIYRDQILPSLQKHLRGNIQGIGAVSDERCVGYMLFGPLREVALPISCVLQDIPVIFCYYTEKKYRSKELDRLLMDEVLKHLKNAPGILTLSSDSKEYMPAKSFIKMGFRSVVQNNNLQILFLPLKQESIEAELFNPELEWDYIRPFTFINHPVCLYLLHLQNMQKKVCERYKNLLPVEELSWQDAHQKDPHIIPGFYCFGRFVPLYSMNERKLKRHIKQCIRAETYKTFGAASSTAYTKRKGKS